MTGLRAGRNEGPGSPFVAPGLTSVIHSFVNPGTGCRPAVRANANNSAASQLSLLGDCLIEAIPDETILALKEACWRNEDGPEDASRASSTPREQPTARG